LDPQEHGKTGDATGDRGALTNPWLENPEEKPTQKDT
jgi:hypothetical protein